MFGVLKVSAHQVFSCILILFIATQTFAACEAQIEKLNDEQKYPGQSYSDKKE